MILRIVKKKNYKINVSVRHITAASVQFSLNLGKNRINIVYYLTVYI